MAIGALLAAGGGLAAKYGETYLKQFQQNRFNRSMVDLTAAVNYAYAKKYAENSPSWTVKGLRDAGLNPILAADGGFTASTGSSVGGYSSSIPSDSANPVSEYLSQEESSTRKKNLEAQGTQIKANIDTLESQKNLNDANASAVLQNASATTMKAQADVAEANARIEEINQRVRFNEAGHGFKTPFLNDASRIGKELYNSPKANDDVRGYLFSTPEADYQRSVLDNDIESARVRQSVLDKLYKSGSTDDEKRKAARQLFFERQREKALEHRRKQYDNNTGPYGEYIFHR